MKKLSLIALLGVLLLANIAAAQPYENSSVVGQVQDRVVITVKDGTKMALDKSSGSVKVGVSGLDALSDRFEVREMEQLYAGMTAKLASKADASVLDRTWAVDFPAEMGLKNVQAAYAALPEVEEVRLVDICKQYDAFLPNDIPSSQYYLRNMNLGGADIHAVGAWNQTLGDSNVIVAVIDSGVDWLHPDLGGPHPDKVNGAIWTNWAEYYGNPNLDDDGNGKIDDIRGWDFVNLSAGSGWPDEDVQFADNDPMDYESHGTGCAGNVAAITNNGIGIAGTAPGCKIMAIRVGWLPNNDTQGVVRMDFASQGILYAVANGAKVINASWGSSSFLQNAVNSAVNNGVLIVTAAGNDDDTVASYLATRNGVLAVAATDETDGKASFSSYGSWVELSAPGVNIYTTYYNRFSQTHEYSSVNGTSFASPITAGAAALLWSANPDALYFDIINLLMDSADNIDAQNPGYEGLLGAGRVNMLRALGDTEHRYPEEFPTMFDAINSSADGDIVAVEGGVSITAPLTVIDKAIEIQGGFSSDYTSRDPINNPSILQGSLNNSCLKFFGDVGPSTVVDGFRIQGGGGLNFSGIPYTGRYGGGVQVQNVSPTLRNLEVTGNSVGSSSELGLGGGIMINNSSAMLENVHVHGNTGMFGAGIFINNSSPTLVNCVVEDNDVITDNLTYNPLGGGIHIVDSNVTMTDCIVSGHTDCAQGGGIYTSDNTNLNMIGGAIQNNGAQDNGGGIFHSSGSLTMLRTEISGNSNLLTSTFMYGGGMYADAATVSLDSVIVFGNSTNAGGGVVFNGCDQADVSNSLFSGNTALFLGGGIFYQNTLSGTVTGNTVAENEATFSGAAGLYVQGANPEITNNIFAFNVGAAGLGNGVALASEPAVFSCNDLFGNEGVDFSGMADPIGSNGNFSADPDFCDMAGGVYNVSNASLCAPDNSGGCALIGAFAAGCGEAPVPDGNGNVPVVFHVEQNFPNPFNPSTTIRFALPSAAHTKVVIFDLAGRKVKTLVDDLMTAQIHDVVWTGKDDGNRQVAAGVYFYRVSSGDHLSVGRMALVK